MASEDPFLIITGLTGAVLRPIVQDPKTRIRLVGSEPPRPASGGPWEPAWVALGRRREPDAGCPESGSEKETIVGSMSTGWSQVEEMALSSVLLPLQNCESGTAEITAKQREPL